MCRCLVGNDEPLQPFHNLSRLNRLFNQLQWLESLCNNAEEILSDLRCPLFRWDLKAALYKSYLNPELNHIDRNLLEDFGLVHYYISSSVGCLLFNFLNFTLWVKHLQLCRLPFYKGMRVAFWLGVIAFVRSSLCCNIVSSQFTRR